MANEIDVAEWLQSPNIDYKLNCELAFHAVPSVGPLTLEVFWTWVIEIIYSDRVYQKKSIVIFMLLLEMMQV